MSRLFGTVETAVITLVDFVGHIIISSADGKHPKIEALVEFVRMSKSVFCRFCFISLGSSSVLSLAEVRFELAYSFKEQIV